MSIKSVDVTFPPNNPEGVSVEEAVSIRNHRVDALLSTALTSGRIGLSDIDEYNHLYHQLNKSSDAEERAEILKRMSIIDGSATLSPSVNDVIGEAVDLTAPLKYFRPC